MKRFEHSIRVITTLFAALLGFGLKTLLDQTVPGKPSYQPWAWPGFLISLLLFTSFLIGSANFLWWRFVQPDSDMNLPFAEGVLTLVREFAFIMVLGGIGISICYSQTFYQFLLWLSAFGLSALVFCTIYVIADRRSTWKPWVWWGCNLSRFLLPFLMLLHYLWGIGNWHQMIDALGSAPGSALSNVGLWILVVAYAVLFLLDLGYQFYALKGIGMPLVGQHLALARQLRDAGISDLREAERRCNLILQLNPNAAEQAEVKDILKTIT